MTRPLYKMKSPPAVLGDGHAGLWYDKFCDAWVVEEQRWSMAAKAKEPSPKLTWLKTVARSVGRPELLGEVAQRQALLADARGGRFGVFSTDGRFVTGTGRSHPVENGFAWHPTLGTPYLPGSSVKGMVRGWARESGASPSRIAAALGAEHPDGSVDDETQDVDREPRTMGRVIMLDAIPVTPPRLEADVLTPHYAAWTPDAPPGDWRSPVPVPFLVTATGADFLFAIVPAGRRGDGVDEPRDAAALIDEVWRWIASALVERGAGAKTAVGYGRFATADATTHRLRDQLARRRAEIRRAAEMQTPEGRWRVAIEDKTEPVVAGLVRQQIRDNQLTDPTERQIFARAVLAGPFAHAWRTGKPATAGLRGGVLPGADGLKALYRLLVAAAQLPESTS